MSVGAISCAIALSFINKGNLMKNSLLLSGLFFSVLFLSPTVSRGQWQPNIRLTNNPAISSLNNAWSIASSGSVVHVIWYDRRDGNYELYHKRSTDGGVSWGTDTRLTNNTADSDYPSVAVSDSVVHVVWRDARDGNPEIYYKRSTDGGVSWGADTRLTNNTASSLFPSIAVSGSVVHVVWHDERDGDWEIYCKRSTDGGVSWGADTRLTNNTAASFFPSIAVSGLVVHVVWRDARDGNPELYYKRSTDGGASWGADTRLTNNTAASFEPSVAVSGLVVHVAWSDARDGNYEIYYKRSTDGGVSWGADTRLTNNTAASERPSAAVSSSVVHVVWSDPRDGNHEIYYKRSTDGGVSWGADTRLTNNTAPSLNLSVAVSGSVVHVVWDDYRDGNWEIYYSRNASDLVVTKPISGERWIGGEQDTIRWTGGQAGQFVDLELSTDSGAVYSLVDFAVPADSGYYIWTVPDSLTTRAKIRVRAVTTPLDTAVSDTFKIKGYVLTRMNAIGHYEAFTPNVHGWSYVNGTLWPRSWWSQFQYTTADDPNTFSPYPPFFYLSPDSTFVDWPLYVEVFSVGSCYWSTSFGWYRGNAQDHWRATSGRHFGSCYGLAVSSFLAFRFPTQFFSKHPEVPPDMNLFSVPLSTPIRNMNNGYYANQFGEQAADTINDSWTKDPRTTLQELKAMLGNDTADIRILSLYGGSPLGGHAVSPVRITMDPSGASRYRVWVYDSNNPGSNLPYILIDSLNNSWADFLGFGWTGTDKLFLDIPVSDHLGVPGIGGPSLALAAGTKGMRFYNTPKADIVYTSSNGNRIGYVGGSIIDEIVEGNPIIRLSGMPSDPLGFHVPNDSYTAVLSRIIDGGERTYLSVFKTNAVYGYERLNSDSSEVDRFSIGEGFSVSSPDSSQKEITLHVIAQLDSSERIFFIRNTQLRQNDSLFAREVSQSNLILKNYGTAKTYHLEINERSVQEQEVFEHPSLTLPANSSHTVVPNWDDLDGSSVEILVDLGNNGTIDDTLRVNNTVDVDDRGALEIPTDYNLAQNYPNPFNPTTRIEYALPLASRVKISVYNVLGQFVATLLDEGRPAGRFAAEWNGTATTGNTVGSGVYFYTMVAQPLAGGEAFKQTGKMILMR